jgi:DNA-binding transcriptional MocR family regulator
MDDLSLVHEAAAKDVDLTTVSNFSIEPLARKGVILGYSEYSVEQIKDGMQRLAAAMRSV